MSCRKTNSCTRHKDLKPVTVDIQKANHSYIINQVQIENEVGKGNINWFNEASRQPVKHDTGDNSQATDTDIRLSQKAKASSQQHEQIRHDNCQPAINTISKKIVDDSCTERSPVNHTGMILDSQFSTTSPMTAWMPPSLGRSPTTGSTQQYDSQYVLIKSLGLNDSTLSWTSSLATPNHNHDEILDKDTKTPNQAKRRCFSRMLFSPGIDTTDEITELSSVKNSKILCSSKLDVNSGLSQSQTESEAYQTDQTPSSVKLDVTCVLESIQDNESFKPLADVLSDFFDPPSKAAGRRRSAPSYRRKSLTRKNSPSLTLSKCSQGDLCQDVGIKPLNEGERYEEFKRKKWSQGAQKYLIKNCENHEFVDSEISKDINIKKECAINIVDFEEKEENTYNSHGDKENTVIDTIKNEVFSQVDLFCSTPIDVKRSYKSILSTSKKKTSTSTKRVRFVKDFIKEVDIDSKPGEIYSCTNLELESLSVSQHSIKEEQSVQENVSPKENENLKVKNNTCTIKQETSREITDDLFSQVSPTVLEEMCSIVSDQNEKSLQVSERESFSSLTSDNVSSDNNADDTVKLPITHSINEDTLVHSPDITFMKSETTTSSNNCSSVEEDKNLALERESLRNHESSVLKKVGKVKRFFYPTNSQINISCPKTVYGFKQHHEVAETMADNKTSIGTEMESVAMTSKLITSDTPSSIINTGLRNTKSTTVSGFKRYSELIKGSESESRKTWPAGEPPSEFNSDSKLPSKLDVCTTPTSARRYSSGLKRRRLCLNENNDKQTTHPKQKLCLNEHYYKQTSYQKQNTQQSCDNTDKVIVSVTVDKSQNQEVHKVKDHKKDNGMSDIDVFDEASFDELQDDSFAKEISMDGTLDKLSGSLGAVCNHGDMKLAADVGNDFERQCQQNVEVMEMKKSDDIVQKKNYDNGTFQGFLTAGGSKIDISKDKMVKAVKLLDSVEFTDDLVVNHDRLNTSTCEMKSGSLIKINQDIDDELYRTEARSPCMKHIDSKVELRSKSENIMMDPEHVNDKIKLNHERNESVMNTDTLITLPISNSCSRPSIIDAEIKVKDDPDLAIRRKQLNNKMSGDKLNCGFATASGKGMTCSMSSHLKVQDLLSDAESQNRSSDDNNVSMRIHDKKEPVINGHIQDGGFSTASGNKLTCSALSLSKAQRIMKELECAVDVQEHAVDTNSISDNYNTCSDGKSGGGFSSTSRKGITFSNPNLSTAEKQIRESEDQKEKNKIGISINDKDEEEHMENVVDCWGGFSTASEKDIPLSVKSLSKAQDLMGNIEKQTINTDLFTTTGSIDVCGNSRVLAESSKDISFVRPSVSKVENSMQDIESLKKPIDIDPASDFNNLLGKSKDLIGYGGFSTASGKDLKFSTTSLSKAQNLMKTVENQNDVLEINSKDENLEDQIKESTSYGGFSTASGKDLKFSTTSLSKAQNLIKDVENQNDVLEINSKDEYLENQSKEASKDIKSYGGFSTASGKGLRSSASSLSKAQNLLKDVENQNSVLETNCRDKNLEDKIKEATSYGGFSTASGKDLKFSTTSLSKAQNLMKTVENQNDVLEMNSKDENLKDEIKEACKDIKSYGGFSTASGKGLKFSTSSLLKGQNLMEAVENNTDMSERHSITSNNENIKDVSTCRQLSSSGKEQRLSLSSETTTQESVEDIVCQNEKTKLATAKSKKEQFENIFNDLLNQNDVNSLLEKQKCVDEIEINLEKELEDMLRSKSCEVKVNKTLKPTKTSRFPPGANIPKGFRPFKPPKIISKTRTNDTCTECRNELESKNVCRKNTTTSALEIDNKQKDVTYKCDQSKTNIADDMTVNTDHDQSKTTIADHMSVNTDPLDSTFLADAFSEDMVFSQNLSPRSDIPVRNISTHNDCSMTSVSLDRHAEQSKKLLHCLQTNVREKYENVVVMQKGGDCKGASFTEAEQEVNFKGDNSNFALEQIMDPENEFTQVLNDDLKNLHSEGDINTNIVSNSKIQSCQNSEMVKEIYNAFQSDLGENVPISEKTLESTNTKSDSDENMINFEKSFCGVRKALNGENTNPFQSASGKRVSVTDTALQHARKTLNDDKSIQDELHTVDNTTANPFQCASGKSVQISDKALQHARETLKGDNLSLVQSGSWTCTSQLEKSPQHARKTLNGEKDHQCEKIILNNDENTNPFQCASGKHVSVSETALQHARKTLKDENTNPFQCASGKSVQISDKALQHARETSKGDNPSPFHNSSGICTSVLEKSPQLTKKTLNDTKTNLFQSASGKSVCVSEKALQYARQTAMDENFQNKARRSLTLPENKIQNLEMSPRQQKSLTENKMGGISHSDKTNSSAAMKRKRVDFDDDFDIPVEIWEQMEMYGKRQKTDDSESKQPMTTVPEDYSQDRQIPGFSPKPLMSQSFTSQSKRLLDHRSNVHQTVPPKSTFNTPYKSSTTADPNREPTHMPHNKIKVVTPVFVPKTSGNLIKENKLCIQQNREPVKVTTSNKDIPVKTAYDDHLNVINSTEGDPKTISDNSITNQNHIRITKEVVQLMQKSREEQKDIIQQKSKKKVVPVEGRLYQIKQSQRRLKLKDAVSFNKNGNQSSGFHFHPSTRKVRFSNTGLHRFYLPDFYGINVHRIIVGDGALLVCDDSGYAGKEEFYQAFLTIEGVDSKLLDDKWFYNHYRWVVWKLAAYEVSSPHQFAGRCLTPEVVMLQMKYRYDREIDKCQRSSIMKICERDDTPCKRMVLCVFNIKYGDSNKEPQVSLTDGWYSINTKADGPLANLIHRDCIQIGHKLCISGAELIGSQDACPPLEAPESLMLKINTNSTRPAPWHSKLGYQTDHTPLCVPLSTLNGEGGTVGCVDVVVVRKYPTMYMEKLAAGGCIFRSYTAEEKYTQSYQQIQQDRMEKLYQQLESQFEKDNREEKYTKRKKWSRKDIEVLNTGQEIYDAVNSSTHTDDIQTYLSTNQLELLMDHQRTVQDEKRQKLNTDFQKAWNDGEENHKQRTVIPLMKIRIIGCCRKDTDSQISSLLTIWRPTSAHTDLTEGRRYKVYSLTASTSRSRSAQRGVQLTATKQTYFKPLPLDDNILDLVYEPREISTKQDLIRKRPTYGEVDVVGIVIDVSNTNIEHSGKQQDIVYVADINDDIIGIKFWGGVKYNGMADILQEGVVCCCSNLCDRSTFQSTNLPIVEFSTELSIISQSPQYPAQRKHIEKLKVKLKDKSEYLNIIKERLDDKSNRRNLMTVSTINPEKINSNTHVLLSNSQTPNLKSAPKMAALLSYQSPSPLSPIVLSSSKSINKAFKPPSLTRK